MEPSVEEVSTHLQAEISSQDLAEASSAPEAMSSAQMLEDSNPIVEVAEKVVVAESSSAPEVMSSAQIPEDSNPIVEVAEASSAPEVMSSAQMLEDSNPIVEVAEKVVVVSSQALVLLPMEEDRADLTKEVRCLHLQHQQLIAPRVLCPKWSFSSMRCLTNGMPTLRTGS